MIKIVKGDLLTVEHGIIGHQVNAKGVMGSGLAKQIRKKYPNAFSEYKEFIDQNEGILLGKVNGVKVDDELFIANMFGQDGYGNDGKQYTDTEALYKCFKTLRTASEKTGLPVYLPYMIGCGLGNADWKEVEGLLLDAFEGYRVTLYKL